MSSHVFFRIAFTTQPITYESISAKHFGQPGRAGERIFSAPEGCLTPRNRGCFFTLWNLKEGETKCVVGYQGRRLSSIIKHERVCRAYIFFLAICPVMTSTIDSVSHLVIAIRTQLGATSRAPTKLRHTRGQSMKTAANRHGAERLDSLISRRIKQIDDDDPQRGHKAFRVFLESVLLAELGEQLINDPKFYQLIDDVQSTMKSDPETGALIDAAIAHLLAEDRSSTK